MYVCNNRTIHQRNKKVVYMCCGQSRDTCVSMEKEVIIMYT